MKIGLHVNQLDSRGTGAVTLAYAKALSKRFSYDIVFITSADASDNRKIPTIKENQFEVIQYKGSANVYEQRLQVKETLSRIVDKEGIDFMYMAKWGTDDSITPQNCKTGIHCVFRMTQPHGTVYAGVSEYIAKKYGHSLHVPHIIAPMPQTENIRREFNIPESVTVLGRLGGKGLFDISFVKDAIKQILNYRKDLYFVFLSTEKFIEHERVIFIDWVEDEQCKFNIIHSCDAMIHARQDGETFGVAVGEFSACNKPIITWSGKGFGLYDTCHLELLGKKAIVYDNYQDVLDIMYSIKREDIITRQWDVYSDRFSEENVINQFNKVFLS